MPEKDEQKPPKIKFINNGKYFLKEYYFIYKSLDSSIFSRKLFFLFLLQKKENIMSFINLLFFFGGKEYHFYL